MAIIFLSVQNPNGDSKVIVDFDHVKNSLKVEDEGKLFYFCLLFLIPLRCLY